MNSNEMFQREIYSVSRLNSEARTVLEGSFQLLWVEGEISNLSRPSSGHLYFSLKDAHTQVRCALFRSKRLRMRYQPENGAQVLLRARVSLYEGRGEFQLIVEQLEPAGEGALRQAFDALKQKLAAEGLFDSEMKLPLPAFPRRIGIITSPTGAAIRDLITVLKRRFPALPIVIYPAIVQGDTASKTIIEMIHLANNRAECDLLVLTRGGGSLEDLMAFNDEQLARAIAASMIPIISAIGHEIDFTIADFVADKRAPTPSAAAEMVSPDRGDITRKIDQLQHRLALQAKQLLTLFAIRVRNLARRLTQQHPGNQLIQKQQRVDELELRLVRSITNHHYRLNDRLTRLTTRISTGSPAFRIGVLHQKQQQLTRRLRLSIDSTIQKQQLRLAALAGSLNTLSPLTTLDRGYAIVNSLPDKSVIRDASTVTQGDRIETLLSVGRLISEVQEIYK